MVDVGWSTRRKTRPIFIANRWFMKPGILNLQLMLRYMLERYNLEKA